MEYWHWGVYVSMCVWMFVCVCVCVCERERERERCLHVYAYCVHHIYTFKNTVLGKRLWQWRTYWCCLDMSSEEWKTRDTDWQKRFNWISEETFCCCSFLNECTDTEKNNKMYIMYMYVYILCKHAWAISLQLWDLSVPCSGLCRSLYHTAAKAKSAWDSIPQFRVLPHPFIAVSEVEEFVLRVSMLQEVMQVAVEGPLYCHFSL